MSVGTLDGPTIGVSEARLVLATLDALSAQNPFLDAVRLRALLSLYLKPDQSPTTLAESMGVSNTAWSGVQYSMEKGRKDKDEKGAGWVQVNLDPNDRRGRLVRLTAKGKAMVENALLAAGAKERGR